MQYRDFVIEASEPALTRDPASRVWQRSFKVRVLDSPAGAMPADRAVFSQCDEGALQRQLRALEARLIDQDELFKLGRLLGLLLLPAAQTNQATSLRELFKRSFDIVGADAGLRLRLQLAPEVSALPWEYMYLDRNDSNESSMLGFLALDPRVAIVRHEVLPVPHIAPAISGVITVMAALASPPDLDLLQLDMEERVLHEALDGQPGIALKLCKDATLDDVERGLTGANVFHFGGHGVFEQRAGAQPGTSTGTGFIALEDRRVSAEQLGVNLRGKGVRLAILGACETGRRAGLGEWGGVAAALVRADVPAIIANQYSILDSSAIAFARKLYTALAGGLPLESAVQAGRIEAYNADRTGRDWGVPVLYLRADGALFAGSADPAVRDKARELVEASVKVRVKELAAGGLLTGAQVREFVSGKLDVNLQIDGTVYGHAVGLEAQRLTAGSVTVEASANTVAAGARLTGVKVDSFGTAANRRTPRRPQSPSRAQPQRSATASSPVDAAPTPPQVSAEAHVDSANGSQVMDSQSSEGSTFGGKVEVARGGRATEVAVMASTPEASERPSARLDFTKIIEERTRDFVERDWVFSAMRAWLDRELDIVTPGNDAGNTTSHMFLLAGKPGTGKTAIAARLAQMHLGQITMPAPTPVAPGGLAYYHFCQTGLDSTLSPITFVQSLSEALANRYPSYFTSLKNIGSQQFIINSKVTANSVANGASLTGVQVRIEILSGDARPLFDVMVRRPLQDLCRVDPSTSIVILVDSLDEALSFNPDSNIAQLLRLVDDFPPQVRFVATCRSDSAAIFDLGRVATLDLVANAPPGQDEILPYARARLKDVPEPGRTEAAQRVATRSNGNFLYAFHVLNDLLGSGTDFSLGESLDLPDALEGVYRQFLQRQLAANKTRWNDVYRPLLGLIAVARGEGLTKQQLVGITDLAEDTAGDVLTACGQYLVGGEESRPYRIYHQSFRDFLLADAQYGVVPAERHAAIARYLEDRYSANWLTCNDTYALRYTALHWAEAATLSESKRETRTQSLVGLTQSSRYQRAFERRIGDMSVLKEYLHGSVQVAALNERADMLPWLIKASFGLVAFDRDYLQAEVVVKLADEGKLQEAEARLRLFADLDENWQTAARLILAWLAINRNPSDARKLETRARQGNPHDTTVLRLLDRLAAALQGPADCPYTPLPSVSLERGQAMVKRISGQAFDRELLGSGLNASLLLPALGPEMQGERSFASAEDAPLLVGLAQSFGSEGTALLDLYVDAHAGYNYVEYRNLSLWYVLAAALTFHPNQDWVKERLRRILVAALTGGSVDFRELLPFTAEVLRDRASISSGAPSVLESLRMVSTTKAQALRNSRGADDSWGFHKRRLTGLMELYALLMEDRAGAEALLQLIETLPGGFAGFQAPSHLRLADALLACRLRSPDARNQVLEAALSLAHNIQDYHFCARVTARCNSLRRWHSSELTGQSLADVIGRLAARPSSPEFAADHKVGEPFRYRARQGGEVLSIDEAQRANTLEQLAEVFQRAVVEFRRLNPKYGLAETIPTGVPISIPDPGLPTLLAAHFSARALSDAALENQRAALIRALVPVASLNPTTLDTALSYLLIATQPDDAELVAEIVKEVGPVAFGDVPVPFAQIGPDSVMPA